jgi:hypothetical protein
MLHKIRGENTARDGEREFFARWGRKFSPRLEERILHEIGEERISQDKKREFCKMAESSTQEGRRALCMEWEKGMLHEWRREFSTRHGWRDVTAR